MMEKIEPVYLLNTSIQKLEDLELITTRVFLNLQTLDLKNLAELLELIRESQTDPEVEKQLENFGQKSVDEVNYLFSQANIKLPETW